MAEVIAALIVVAGLWSFSIDICAKLDRIERAIRDDTNSRI